MSDIFVSYASKDRPWVFRLVHALERHGWSVWWDCAISPGKTYDQVIEEALDAARCVIVVWSQASVGSDWVKTEATEGAGRHILVPVLLDEVRIPLEFRRIQAANLIDWQDTGPHAEFDKLVQAVTAIIGPTPPSPRFPDLSLPASPQDATHPVLQPGHDIPGPKLSSVPPVQPSPWSRCLGMGLPFSAAPCPLPVLPGTIEAYT